MKLSNAKDAAKDAAGADIEALTAADYEEVRRARPDKAMPPWDALPHATKVALLVEYRRWAMDALRPAQPRHQEQDMVRRIAAARKAEVDAAYAQQAA